MKKYHTSLMSIIIILATVAFASCASRYTELSTSETTTVTEPNISENNSKSESESSCSVSSEAISIENNSTEENESIKNEELMITSPIGEQYPYVEEAKNYLEASNTNVKDYFRFMKNPCVPIVVTWEYPEGIASAFSVEISTKSDFSDALVINVADTCRSCELYNLYKSTAYFVKVIAYSGNKILNVAESSFTTASLGPRVMKVDGIYNVRDLGGYIINSGETTLQGLLYRGGALTPADVYDSLLTENGKIFMSEKMRIKTEIDLRTPTEAGNLNESLIPGASLVYIPLGGYGEAFSDSTMGKQAYRELFSTLANESNYPIYYHCTGGADRTGTVSFLLNALLGVDEEALIKDYEFTSFSVYHMRNTKEGDYASHFKEFRDKLEGFEGATLQKKVENYLLSIGVTEDEIYNIKAIMSGKPTRLAISAPGSYTLNLDESFDIAICGKVKPIKLTISGTELEFESTRTGISISGDKLDFLTKGTHIGSVLFETGEILEFVFDFDVYSVFDIDAYMDFDESDRIVINASNSQITGFKSFGYGKTVRVKMKSEMPSDSSGGIYMLIGSYGFLLRGGEFRIVQMSDSGVIGEYARYTGLNFASTAFNSGDLILYLTVELAEKPTLNITVDSGNNMQTFTYVYQTPVENAISDSDAKITFAINTSSVSSLTVFNQKGYAE